MKTKFCSGCKKMKSVSRFWKSASRYDGLQGICKICLHKRNRARESRRREEQPNWRYDYNLRRKYGVDRGYAELLELQGGVCAMCGLPPELGKRLVADHDHKTTVLRALLHNRCNLIIGWAEDDVKLMKKAVAYLKQFGDGNPLNRRRKEVTPSVENTDNHSGS